MLTAAVERGPAYFQFHERTGFLPHGDLPRVTGAEGTNWWLELDLRGASQDWDSLAGAETAPVKGPHQTLAGPEIRAVLTMNADHCTPLDKALG